VLPTLRTESQQCGLTIGSSDRGALSSLSQERVDDLDKSVSIVVGASPRRSTSSLDALDWGRRNFVSSLRSAAQPLLIDVAQNYRAAVLGMTAAHGRGGTGERSASKRGALQTLRFASEQT